MASLEIAQAFYVHHTVLHNQMLFDHLLRSDPVKITPVLDVKTNKTGLMLATCSDLHRRESDSESPSPVAKLTKLDRLVLESSTNTLPY